MSELLSMKNITKRYGNGVLANEDASFSLREGEIHAIAGENGAGKSTLMKILFGAEQPSEGVIELHGKPVRSVGNNRPSTCPQQGMKRRALCPKIA